MVKPNTIHILTTNVEFPTNNHLYLALTALNYEVTFVDPYRQTYLLDMPPCDEIPELVLNRCTGIQFDDIDLVLSRQYQEQNSFVINPPDSVPIFRNKDQQLLYIKQKGLPIIPTVIQRSEIIDDESIKYLDSFQSTEQYILKNIRGQGGKGVIRLNSRESLYDLVQTRHLMHDQRYLIQPFLQLKKEFRVYYAGTEAICAIEKTSTSENGKFNLASAEFEDIALDKLPKQIKKSHKTVGDFPLFFYCVDWVLADDGEIYLLEVNTVPGINGLQNKNDLVAAIMTNSRNHVKL